MLDKTISKIENMTSKHGMVTHLESIDEIKYLLIGLNELYFMYYDISEDEHNVNKNIIKAFNTIIERETRREKIKYSEMFPYIFNISDTHTYMVKAVAEAYGLLTDNGETKSTIKYRRGLIRLFVTNGKGLYERSKVKKDAYIKLLCDRIEKDLEFIGSYTIQGQRIIDSRIARTKRVENKGGKCLLTKINKG